MVDMDASSPPSPPLFRVPPHWRVARRHVEKEARSLLDDCKVAPDAPVGAVELVTWYLSDRPRKFFCRATFRAVVDVLQSVSDDLVLSDGTLRQLVHGLTWLRNENVSASDERLPYGDPLTNYKIQQVYLRQYAHLAEYVYFGIIGALLEISPRARSLGKNKPSVKLDSRWKQARAYLAREISGVYHTELRNAIVHGGVLFEEGSVVFVDQEGRRNTRSHEECCELPEKLLDVCNGVSLAFAVVARLRPDRLPQDVEMWADEEYVMSLVATPLLTPISFQTDTIAKDVRQHILICSHRHWLQDLLRFDLGRALVVMKSELNNADRYFVSAKDVRGMPSFLAAEAEEIPDGQLCSDSEFGKFLVRVGNSSMVTVEHELMVHAVLSRLKWKHLFNWVDASDRPVGDVDYELRHLEDNSVARQARFRAVVVSVPRDVDLDEEGVPTFAYLASIFYSTFVRWSIRRAGRRGAGADRIKLFRSGIISVIRKDGRLREVHDAGLTSSLLFRFEFAFGAPKNRVGLGGSPMLRRGIYWISLNPKAEKMTTPKNG